MDDLRKAQASSGKSMVLPVDGNGNNIEEIMKEIAGKVLQEAMPDLMQQMGATERNPIMQGSSGIVLPLCTFIISASYQGLPIMRDKAYLCGPLCLCAVLGWVGFLCAGLGWGGLYGVLCCWKFKLFQESFFLCEF